MSDKMIEGGFGRPLAGQPALAVPATPLRVDGPTGFDQAQDRILAPFVPTEAQWNGLARQIMMWLDMHPRTPRALFQHLKRSGHEIPHWLTEESEMKALDHTPSKGTRCAIIYRAMLEDLRREGLRKMVAMDEKMGLLEADDCMISGDMEWSEPSERRALAAAAREGGDVKQAPAESPQSGPKGNAQPPVAHPPYLFSRIIRAL